MHDFKLIVFLSKWPAISYDSFYLLNFSLYLIYLIITQNVGFILSNCPHAKCIWWTFASSMKLQALELNDCPMLLDITYCICCICYNEKLPCFWIFELVISNPPVTTTLIVGGSVKDINYYYRIVPPTLPANQILLLPLIVWQVMSCSPTCLVRRSNLTQTLIGSRSDLPYSLYGISILT